MIRFTNVSMTYPDGNEALRNINLEVAQGAMVYITGRSGAGKSTLLRLIALIDRASRGQIIINGQKKANIVGCKKKGKAQRRRRLKAPPGIKSILLDVTTLKESHTLFTTTTCSHGEVSQRTCQYTDILTAAPKSAIKSAILVAARNFATV